MSNIGPPPPLLPDIDQDEEASPSPKASLSGAALRIAWLISYIPLMLFSCFLEIAIWIGTGRGGSGFDWFDKNHFEPWGKTNSDERNR